MSKQVCIYSMAEREPDAVNGRKTPFQSLSSNSFPRSLFMALILNSESILSVLILSRNIVYLWIKVETSLGGFEPLDSTQENQTSEPRTVEVMSV